MKICIKYMYMSFSYSGDVNPNRYTISVYNIYLSKYIYLFRCEQLPQIVQKFLNSPVEFFFLKIEKNIFRFKVSIDTVLPYNLISEIIIIRKKGNVYTFINYAFCKVCKDTCTCRMPNILAKHTVALFTFYIPWS